jgi:hypothetical protein
MKNEILDTPFRDSFADYLIKGETIVWEGQPSSINNFGNDDEASDDYDNHRLFTMFIIGIGIFTYLTKIPWLVFILFLTLFFLAIILPKWNRQNKRNFSYAITEKQILFQIKEKWKRHPVVYSIPFSKIKHIIIVMTFDVEKRKKEYENIYEDAPTIYNKEGIEKIGTIFIVPHQPELISFETSDLINHEKRHQPTLELLEEVTAVAEIIRKKIKNANTL